MKTYSKKEIAHELLVIKQAKKDPRHFAFLYERYYKSIFLFVHRRSGNNDVAGDITSQVFLKALNNIHKYKFKGVPFVAWLFRIASNEINMYFRKNAGSRTVSLEDAGIHRITAEVSDEDEDNKLELLLTAIEKLTDDEITLLELRYFELRSVKEVAYILNQSESNIKVKSHRIIKKIKSLVQSNSDND